MTVWGMSMWGMTMSQPESDAAMRLEPATAADLPAVVALMNAAFRGTGQAAGWNTEAGYIDGDRTSIALINEEFAEAPDAVLLLSRLGDEAELLGCVWLEPAGDDVWYLGSLTVDPKRQNGGAGSRLLEAAEAWALERDARTICMKVVNIRDTLIAWYGRRGYRLTGEVEPFPYGDERFGIPRRDDLLFVTLDKSLVKPG